MLILTIKNTANPVGLQNAMKSNVSLVLIKGFFKWIRRKQTTFFPYSNAQLCIVESIQTLNFSLGILSKVSFWPLHCSLIKFEFILFFPTFYQNYKTTELLENERKSDALLSDAFWKIITALKSYMTCLIWT